MTSDASKRAPSSSVARKISKGVIERKRRARINHSLTELKVILLNETKDKGLHAKLDKAEILERTLSYVQSLQTRSNPVAAMDKYREGYLACVQEVDRFLSMEKVDDLSRQKFSNFLAYSQAGFLQFAPQPAFNPSPSPSLSYAVVPQSPSPSMMSSSGSYSSMGSPSFVKSEPVWRPW